MLKIVYFIIEQKYKIIYTTFHDELHPAVVILDPYEQPKKTLNSARKHWSYNILCLMVEKKCEEETNRKFA